MDHKGIKNLVLAALFLALGLVFPSFFHMIGLGRVFSPMHLPVLLCGFICGWKYGALVGLAVPLLSSFTGMPPLFPTGVAMAAELCGYGLLTGLLYKRFNVFISLIGAMLGGRLILGAVNAVLYGVSGTPYGFAAFWSSAFVQAVPAILLQLVAVPLLVLALQKAGLIKAPARA